MASQPGKRAQSGLLPGTTTEVKATRVKHPIYGNRIVLLDTPGFDSNTANALGPFQVLQKIQKWLTHQLVINQLCFCVVLTFLKCSYDDHVRLTGLVYLQQITNLSEPYQHEALAKELCGDTILSRAILVTTMWHEIEPEEGRRREQDLICLWDARTQSQSTVHRLGDGSTDLNNPDALRKSAWDFIVPLITKHDDRESIFLQEDFAALQAELCKEKEGKVAWDQLQENLMMRMEIQRKLSQALQQDRAQQEMLRKVEDELRDTLHRVSKWKNKRFAAMIKRAVLWPSKGRHQRGKPKTKQYVYFPLYPSDLARFTLLLLQLFLF